MMSHYQPAMLAIPTSRDYKLVREDEVLYCQSDGNYTYIYFCDGTKLLVCKKLKDLEKALDTSFFIRVHHSFLVNMYYATKYIVKDGCRLMLKNGKTINVSRNRKKELMEFLKKI